MVTVEEDLCREEGVPVDGKLLVSVDSRVAPGTELGRPRAGWTQEKRGNIHGM